MPKPLILTVVLFLLIFAEGKAQTAESDSLFAFGVRLYQAGDYAEAIPLFAQCDSIDKATLPETSNRRNYAAIWLASCYYQLGDTIKAEETHKYYANAPVDRRLTVKSDSLAAAGLIAFNNGDLENALTYFEQCAEIEKAVVGEEHIWYLNTLSSIDILYFKLARNNFSLGNYAEAIKLGTKELDICAKLYGKEHPYYATSLNNLANYTSSLGNYAKAIRLGTEAMNIYEELYGTEHPDYATSIDNLALYNSDLGNYAEAIRLSTEAMNIWEKLYGKEHPDYATSLNNLANCYYDLGNYAEAIRLGTEAMNIKEKVYGKEHPSYAASLNNLASYNSDLGNYTEAVSLCTVALNIREKVYGKEHPDYAQSLNNLANYNASLGDYEEAIRLSTEALNIREKIYGKEHPDYANSLHNLADYYFYSRDVESTNYYSLQFSELASALIKKTFAGQTSSQRQQFWEKYKAWYEGTVHRFSYVLPSDTLTMSGYNGALLSKGLLLNSEIEFTKLIQESGDDTILVLYENLRNMRNQTNKLWEGYASADSIKLVRMRQIADSLSRESDKVEQQLLDSSKVYGDFTKNLVITWPQIQEKLGEGDAAVEFVSFPLNADSTMYIAYVLRKDWDCPRMIPLFEEKELEAVEGYDYYTTPSVSHLVWEPLEEALEGADHVYFSPGGDLYNIAIESVPDHLDPAHIVSERRDYYRLSSTRELALIQDDYTWTEGAVYGGLDYNMGVSSLAADEAHYTQSASEGQRKRGIDLSYYYLSGEDFAEGIRSDRKSSGLLDSLPGTREEAVAIKAQLDDISVPSSLYTDDLGTEASFKALDGQRTSIIHIGTHGFFNTKKAEYQDPTSLLMTSSQQSVRVEDDALSRSGLCMAGANNLLTSAEALPDSLDDGWLTALEIAHLDLRGLDMVVLSACKTGVGEVTGDGVFGLQRGFKKAGARTLVMSLWNVPDQLTCYFMKEFFARIEVDANGHPTNKHAAFLQAQQAARTNWREVDPHATPYDWAAFILLDGVD